jgi:hypothetical protein
MQLGEIQIEGVRDGTSYLPADFFGKTEGEAHASSLVMTDYCNCP